MTEQSPPPVQADKSLGTEDPPFTVHSWWERAKKRNLFVVASAIVASIVITGEILNGVEAIEKLLPSGPSAKVSPQTDPQPASLTPAASPGAGPSGLPGIQLMFADGRSFTVRWDALVQVAPQDAPTYAVEFNSMEDVKRQLSGAFKRELIRKTASLESKQFLGQRTQIEKELGEILSTEFKPRGVTVQDISLGEVTAQ